MSLVKICKKGYSSDFFNFKLIKSLNKNQVKNVRNKILEYFDSQDKNKLSNHGNWKNILTDDFHKSYFKRFGHSNTSEKIEIVNVRLAMFLKKKLI